MLQTAMNPVTTPLLDLACQKIQAGDVVAVPTETVYGLAADACKDQAVAKIFALKNRPSFNPLIIHVLDLKQIREWVDIPPMAETLTEEFWPGPLTLVLPLKPDNPLSNLCTVGLPTVAIRSPAHPVMREIIERTGCPLAAPSANPSTQLSPTSALHVADAFKDKELLIVDGGSSEVGLESTIVDVTMTPPVLLRPGGIPQQTIEHLLGQTLGSPDPEKGIRSPGQLYKHYAPQSPVRLNVTEPLDQEVFLTFGPNVPPHTPSLNLSPTGDLIEAASNLFAYLHQLDAGSPNGIAVAPIPYEGVGVAINDRLLRASRG